MRKSLTSLLILLMAFPAFAAPEPSNKFKMGDGTASNKVIEMNRGGSNPQIRWSESDSKLQFSNDGADFKNLGSGGGGAAGVNLLVDSDFDFEASGTTQWTTPSGGTFTKTTTLPAFGTRSGSFDASASSQVVQSAFIAIPDGLKNQAGLASCFFQTSATDYKLQVYDGTNVIAETTIAASTDYSKQSMIYTHPGTGSLRLRVISASNAAAVKIDNCYMGEATTLPHSQASLIASMYVPNNVSCNQSTGSASLAAFGTQAGCPAPVVEYSSGIGTPSTADADSAVIFTINNLPAGTYVGVMETQAYNSGTAAALNFGLTDGTTQSGVIGLQVAVNDVGPVVVSGVWTYATAGNRTFQLLGATTAGGTATLATNGALNNTHFKLYRYPTTPVETYTFDTINWRVDANIGGSGNFDLPASVVSSFTEMTSSVMDLVVNSGSVDTQIACSGTNPSTGTTCAAGDESNGIAFSIPRAGAALACASFSHYSSGLNGGVTFQIVETPNNAQTILQEGKTRLQNSTTGTPDQVSTLRLCGVFNFASAGQKTLRVMFEQNLTVAANNSVLGDRDANTGQRDIHWEVYPIDQQVPAPLIPNIVTNTSASPVRIQSAYINQSAGSASVNQEVGSWISSITDNGTGDATINFVPGTFSASPVCVQSIIAGNTAAYTSISSISSSLVRVVTYNSTPAAAEYDFNITCVGLK